MPPAVERRPLAALRVGDVVRVSEDQGTAYAGCVGRVAMICGRVALVAFGGRRSWLYFRPQIAKLAS